MPMNWNEKEQGFNPWNEFKLSFKIFFHLKSYAFDKSGEVV